MMKISIRSLRHAAVAMVASGLAVIMFEARGDREIDKAEDRSLVAIRGLSQWWTLLGTETCSEYNARHPDAPLPPGNYVGAESCAAEGDRCVQCGIWEPNNGQHFSVTSTPGPGSFPGKTDPISLPCGQLAWGFCTQYPDGHFECDNRTLSGDCAAATEYHNQPVPGPDTPNP